ncbi:MAG: hypothetical protein P1U63_12275 [Coxiellaceae bacterium]|nr:hypothetical protein [Coxiellaceae bacterium]
MRQSTKFDDENSRMLVQLKQELQAFVALTKHAASTELATDMNNKLATILAGMKGLINTVLGDNREYDVIEKTSASVKLYDKLQLLIASRSRLETELSKPSVADPAPVMPISIHRP